ncbi:TonB-dependent receptor [Chitinophaga sedimenti]|uniref:TonB-dependent receptor n=1 Tax=Chitinophaga sedimenti TaxID=2033606 RepID=UPI0020069BF3|nr:TonB-dependent receptor [Chitinophaga sedimenti]MCK7557716.1 TonB-dependent receptor [Chitinophaga sedimenti]
MGNYKKIEAALELGFWEDRLLFNISLYKNRTDNQLVGYPLSSATGFTSIRANLPAVIDNKGIEFEIISTNVKTKKFEWTSNANLAINRNKLVAYPDIETSSFATRYVVGMPLRILFLYKLTGIDPQQGIYTFFDKDKNGTISPAADKIPFLRQQIFAGGMNHSLSYKNFSVDLFVQFVNEPGLLIPYRVYPGSFSENGLNQPVEVLDRWQKPGDNSKFQKYSQLLNVTRNVAAQYTESNAIIADASFIRLKNLSISWSTPSQWRQRRIPNIRLFVQGQNLLTFTKYSGLDPESQGNFLPPLQTVNTGIQITL